MINVEVRQRQDDRWDIYVSDGGNHEPLLNSSQGYENEGAARAIAVRLFGGRPAQRTERERRPSTPRRSYPEPVDLIITKRDGVKTRTVIR